MTTNTTTTTTTTTDNVTNTTATTTMTNTDDNDTDTHKETLTDSNLNNSKTSTNNNNNDNNNINQNVDTVTETETQKSPSLLVETDVKKSPSWDLKESQDTNFAESELNLIENKYQSLTKINSSILCRQFKDNNNLVSLELDLGNNIDLKQAEDNGKLINLEENVKSAETLNIEENKILIDCFLDSDSYKLLEKLPINNPFYRFHKQSNSFREINMKKTSWDFLSYSTRKFKSDTDLLQNHNTIINNIDDKTTTAAAATINGNKNIFNNNCNHKQNNIVVVANQCKNNHNCNNITTLNRNQRLDIKFSRQQFNRLQQPDQQQQEHQQQEQSLSNSGLPAHSVSNALILIKPNDFINSTVITNPFSIFHDDESHLTLTVDKRLRCASSASRRLLRKPVTATSTSSTSSGGSVTLQTPKPFTSQQHLNNYHYLYGVPIKKFERQDFAPPKEAIMARGVKKSKLPTSSSSSSVFKQISLRKISKTASASSSNINVPLTGPQLKRLKITYPNLTQPLAATTGHNKNTYFSRLQAKTRQGLQKLRDKCKQFNYHTSQRSHLGRLQHTSSFKTMSKVESFRFISDRDNIRNYETRCMAAYHQDHKKHPGTLYKSYKSELDLSKNLNYLEAYLNQNFEQQNSAQSVGRHQGQKIRRAFHHMTESTNLKHKRNNSHSSAEGGHHVVSPKKLNLCKNNYENVQNSPLNKSDSLSSSDYASVFSANCGEDNLSQHKTDKTDLSSHTNLRYEHPKMSEFNKLKQTKPSSDQYQLRGQQPLPPQRPLNVEDTEVEENELAFKQELLSICQNKDNIYFENDFPLDIPEDEEDELACSNIRILINNSEDFERSPDDDWYMQRSENANLTEVAFYQSLNEQLQQEDLYDDRTINYDPFMPHLPTDLYNFDTETEDEKQLISSTSSLQRCQQQNLSNSYKYNYSSSLNEKSLHLPDYKTAEENAQLMQNLYKTYQTQALAKPTALSSSSSTSSIHQQQPHSHTQAPLPTQNSAKFKHTKISNPLTPLSYNTNNHTASFGSNQRNSSSSTDTYDNFVTTRSYPQKIPSKRSSFSQYTQRSPIQPQINALNYYGVSTSNDTYSIPFKLQSSSSSSNHSSKLSNSSSNSTTSSSHTTNPLIISSNHIGNSLASAATASSPATQINLTKLYNNQNNTLSSNNTAATTIITNAATQPTVAPALLYHQEKRDKFILEYKC